MNTGLAGARMGGRQLQHAPGRQAAPLTPQHHRRPTLFLQQGAIGTQIMDQPIRPLRLDSQVGTRHLGKGYRDGVTTIAPHSHILATGGQFQPPTGPAQQKHTGKRLA